MNFCAAIRRQTGGHSDNSKSKVSPSAPFAQLISSLIDVFTSPLTLFFNHTPSSLPSYMQCGDAPLGILSLSNEVICEVLAYCDPVDVARVGLVSIDLLAG